jgi:hypothetical protein
VNAARSTISAAAFLCVLGIATGCGGGDSGVEPVTKPMAARPSAEARRAVADPGSAASVVIRYWQSIQREALPLSLSLYAPRVVDAVGLSNFAGMLAAQRATVRDVRLNIVGIQTAAGGRLVTAEALPETGAKVDHSFFLRKQGNRWRVLYDTVAAAAIRPYVQDQIQRAINSNAAQPSTRAVQAGDRALDAYRRSSLSLARGSAR